MNLENKIKQLEKRITEMEEKLDKHHIETIKAFEIFIDKLIEVGIFKRVETKIFTDVELENYADKIFKGES